MVVSSCINTEKRILARRGLASVSNKEVIQFQITLNERNISILVGDEMKQITIDSEKEVYLTETDKKDLESRRLALMQKSELSNEERLFLNILEMLIAWPSNIAIFLNGQPQSKILEYSLDGKETINAYDFDKKNVKIPVKLNPISKNIIEFKERESLFFPKPKNASFVDICKERGKRYTAKYLDNNLEWKEFTAEVGGQECVGRCGKGCPTMKYPNQYTRNCFQHDYCVTANNGNYTAEACNILFIFCAMDMFQASNCN